MGAIDQFRTLRHVLLALALAGCGSPAGGHDVTDGAVDDAAPSEGVDGPSHPDEGSADGGDLIIGMPPGGGVPLVVDVTGAGTVSSSPAGITCAGDCNQGYAMGTTVTLSAVAASGSIFVGWGGACNGTASCVVTMTQGQRAIATFMPRAGAGVGYFVATDGSDTNDGKSLAKPFLTIGKAVSVVSPGDVIDVRGGTYAEHVTISRPGAANAGITLRSYAGERAVLKSTGAGPTVYVYHDDCDEGVIGTGSGNTDCKAFYWTLLGLEIQGGVGGGADGNAIKIDVPKVRLVGNRLCCSEADVVKMVRTSNDVEVLDNEIWQDSAKVPPSDNAQGVDIVGADRVRVAANYLHDIHDIGIYAKGNARNTIFEDNRLVNIGVHALMLGQQTDTDRLVDGLYESYDGIIRNNVVVGADWACVATSSSQNVHIYNNSCYDTGRVTHGSVLLSNESEVGQAGLQIELRNNIFFGSAQRPILNIGSASMSDYHTLVIDKNLYFVLGGAPTFTWSDELDAGAFASWQTKYTALSGHIDSSVVADPRYTNLSGSFPLTLEATSPALGAGAATTIVPSDLFGTNRPSTGTIDIGAYEY